MSDSVNSQPTKLKLDASKSRFAQKAAAKQDFETQADQTYEQIQNKKQKAFELSQEFLDNFKSKILPENKGPIEQSLERDLIKKITEFCVDVNNDPNELEGMGSVGVNILLLKCIIILRDNLNKAEHNISLLQKQLQSKSQTDVK